MLPKHIVGKIINISIPVNEIDDKFIWEFTRKIFSKRLSIGQIMMALAHILKLSF